MASKYNPFARTKVDDSSLSGGETTQDVMDIASRALNLGREVQAATQLALDNAVKNADIKGQALGVQNADFEQAQKNNYGPSKNISTLAARVSAKVENSVKSMQQSNKQENDLKMQNAGIKVRDNLEASSRLTKVAGLEEQKIAADAGYDFGKEEGYKSIGRAGLTSFLGQGASEMMSDFKQNEAETGNRANKATIRTNKDGTFSVGSENMFTGEDTGQVDTTMSNVLALSKLGQLKQPGAGAQTEVTYTGNKTYGTPN